MKTKPNVVLSSQIPGKPKRKDIIHHDELYIITDRGQTMIVSVVDEQVAVAISPRYVNIVFSQRVSAENAAQRLNEEFKTDRFEVRVIKCLD